MLRVVLVAQYYTILVERGRIIHGDVLIEESALNEVARHLSIENEPSHHICFTSFG